MLEHTVPKAQHATGQRLEAASLPVSCEKSAVGAHSPQPAKKKRVMRELMTRFYPMGSRLATRAKGDALKYSMRVWRPRVYCRALLLGESRQRKEVAMNEQAIEL